MKNLVVYQKTYDMIKYGYIALRQFPKSEKHTFAADIKQSMVTLLRLIIICNKKYYKKTTMKELDTELELLRNYIRLALDLGFLPFKKYEIWAGQLEEIGKLRKSTKKKMKRRLVYLRDKYEKGEITFPKIHSSVQSYMGIMKHCNSYNLRRKVLQELKFSKKDRRLTYANNSTRAESYN